MSSTRGRPWSLACEPIECRYLNARNMVRLTIYRSVNNKGSKCAERMHRVATNAGRHLCLTVLGEESHLLIRTLSSFYRSHHMSPFVFLFQTLIVLPLVNRFIRS